MRTPTRHAMLATYLRWSALALLIALVPFVAPASASAATLSVTTPAPYAFVGATAKVRGTVAARTLSSVTVGIDGTRGVVATIGRTSTPGVYSFAAALPTGGYTEGAHLVVVSASTGGGTIRSRVPVTIDRTAPLAGINSPTAGAVLNGLVSALGVASDRNGVLKVTASFDDRSPVSVSYAATTSTWRTSSFPVSNLGQGDHVIVARAYDRAGNVSVVRRSFVVDSAGPTIALASPVAYSTLSGGASVLGNVADVHGIRSIEVAIDRQDAYRPAPSTVPTGVASYEGIPVAINFDYGFDTRSLTNGGHTIYVRSFDGLGNVRVVSVAVKVQNGTTVT